MISPDFEDESLSINSLIFFQHSLSTFQPFTVLTLWYTQHYQQNSSILLLFFDTQIYKNTIPLPQSSPKNNTKTIEQQIFTKAKFDNVTLSLVCLFHNQSYNFLLTMQDIRYIQNPFLKIFNIVHPDHNKIFSLLIKLLEKFFKDIKLPTVMCQASIPAKSCQDISAYTGASGYLYMFIRLYRYFSKQSEMAQQKFSSNSHIVGDELIYKLKDPHFYLKLAEEEYRLLEDYIHKHKKDRSCYSFLMSQVSVWLCGMHLGFILRNLALFRENEERIIKSFHNLKQNLNKTQWELLYGVPGFLYAVLELQTNYDSAQELFKTHFSPISMELTDIIINRGIVNFEEMTKTKVNLQKIPENFRLVYHFHKKQYLGGAHGLGGNLNIILSSIKYNSFGPKLNHYLSVIKPSVTFLLKHLINGNFATSAGSQNVKLVHFCHGAPGIVTALAKFADIFPQISIQMGIKQVIQVNLDHIWKYGVLKKGFGLCHGISGNAYAFISPSIQHVLHQRADQLRKKAQLFALLHEEEGVMKEISTYNFEDRDVMGVSDEPYSLMVGIAGDICFAIDVIKGTGLFPGYDV